MYRRRPNDLALLIGTAALIVAVGTVPIILGLSPTTWPGNVFRFVIAAVVALAMIVGLRLSQRPGPSERESAPQPREPHA